MAALVEEIEALAQRFSQPPQMPGAKDLQTLEDTETNAEVYQKPIAGLIVQEMRRRKEEKDRKDRFPVERQQIRRPGVAQRAIDKELAKSATGGYKLHDRFGFDEVGFLDFNISLKRALALTQAPA
jgi:hypothetical protein